MKATLIKKMALLFCAPILLVPSVRAQNSEFVVRDAWIRVPLPAHNQTAAYMVIENRSSTSRAIVSASSPLAGSVELHEMKMDPVAKTMSMNPVESIPLPAKGKATLKQGGYHMMVFGLKSRPTAGSAFPIKLKLDDGSTIEVSATARNPAAEETMKGMK